MLESTGTKNMPALVQFCILDKIDTITKYGYNYSRNIYSVMLK